MIPETHIHAFLFVVLEINKLELMFMKHYAPNRCLYIKVAKLRTGLGSAEISHLQNIAVSKYQGRCEQRSEVFVKIPKKKIFFFFFFFFGGGGSGRGGCSGGGGHRVDVNKELKFFCEKSKKIYFFFLGGGGLGRVGGGQGGCERSFCENLKKKGGLGSGGGVGLGGGSGWM